MQFRLKEAFVCDFCAEDCGASCKQDLIDISNGIITDKNKDLIGRKHLIHCLGQYCDKPCKRQRKEYTPYNENDGIKPLVDSIMFLGNMVNNLLEEKYEKRAST